MGKFFKGSWKTTIGGVLAVATAVYHVIQGGALDSTTLTQILAGIGLIFAKDSNVTGGTKVNPSSTVVSVDAPVSPENPVSGGSVIK